MADRRLTWPGGEPVAQNFSLPSSIVYYMARNPPSVDFYNRMVKSCKWFYSKNPIIPFQTINGRRICEKYGCDGCDKCLTYDPMIHAFKLWPTGKVVFTGYRDDDTIPRILSSIYQCDAIEVILSNKLIQFGDLKKLARTARRLFLYHCWIVEEDGSIVMIEKLIDGLPKLVDLIVHLSPMLQMVDENSFENLLHNDRMKTFKRLSLNDLSPNVSIPNMNDLIAWVPPTCRFFIEFGESFPISEEKYTALDHCVDNIVTRGMINRFIVYAGQDNDYGLIMNSRYNSDVDIN